MKTSAIVHNPNARFLTLYADFIAICAYESETPKSGVVVKNNDCAAALLALYDHFYSKEKGNTFSNSFLEKCLQYHYSSKTIIEANKFLEYEGYICIKRNKISETENAANTIELQVNVVNEQLSKMLELRIEKEKDEYFYPTVILHNPYRKFTEPYRKITENKDNSNNNSNNKEEKKGTFFPTKDNNQHEQAQPNQLHLEQKKESHPPIPLAPPPLKNKGKKDRASIAIPTSLNNADFLAEWEKLLQTKKWKGKEDSTLEGILEKLSTFDVRFATELANQARLNEWQGIIFAQTAKNYEIWLKSNAQSTNSLETVQLSILSNSGLKTLKIARKCKAYEIAESLVDKQTGFILTEAISQKDKDYIAWITRNITNHINNNTIEKQEWFCGFVVRKQ